MTMLLPSRTAIVARLGAGALGIDDDEPSTLGQTTVAVEPGANAYTTITAGPGPSDLHITVSGLDADWYTLGSDTLRPLSNALATVELQLHPPTSANLGLYPFLVEVRDTRENGGSIATGQLQVVGSELLDYLPRMFQGPEHEMLGRFLLIFQRILEPIERTINNRADYLDPWVTPAEFLPWLATWLDVWNIAALDEGRQRNVIARAVELYRWKGTRRGVREEIELRTGARVLLVEQFDGLRLGHDAALGINTQLGQACDGSLTVTLVWPHAPEAEEERRAVELVREIIPAHVGYVVRSLPPQTVMGS